MGLRWCRGTWWHRQHRLELWSNSNPIPLTCPDVGTYIITLDVQNECGIDSTSITVVVRDPLSATLNGPANVCEGDPIAFNAISPEADSFRWDFFGTDQFWIPTSNSNVTYTHSNPGTYNVMVEVALNGESPACSAQATLEVNVHSKPEVEVALTAAQGCDSLIVEAAELALQGTSYEWVLPDGTHASGPTTAPISLTTTGEHVFAVTATDAFGCTNTADDVATVHASPVATFVAEDVAKGRKPRSPTPASRAVAVPSCLGLGPLGTKATLASKTPHTRSQGWAHTRSR